MTNREFFNAVVTANISDELTAFAREALQKLDTRNEARKNKPSKTAIANEPIKAQILAYVTENAKAIASDIAVACGITTAKASSLCTRMVSDGTMKSEEVKIKGRKVHGYSVA